MDLDTGMTIKPAHGERLVGLVITSAAGAGFALYAWWSSEFTIFGRLLLLVASGLFVAVGVDHYLKQYRFSRESVSVRYFGIWRHHAINSSIAVKLDTSGRLVVKRHSRRRPIVTVGRGFGVTPQEIEDVAAEYGRRVS